MMWKCTARVAMPAQQLGLARPGVCDVQPQSTHLATAAQYKIPDPTPISPPCRSRSGQAWRGPKCDSARMSQEGNPLTTLLGEQDHSDATLTSLPKPERSGLARPRVCAPDSATMSLSLSPMRWNTLRRWSAALFAFSGHSGSPSPAAEHRGFEYQSQKQQKQCR